jgi:hypothetical protein
LGDCAFVLRNCAREILSVGTGWLDCAQAVVGGPVIEIEPRGTTAGASGESNLFQPPEAAGLNPAGSVERVAPPTTHRARILSDYINNSSNAEWDLSNDGRNLSNDESNSSIDETRS